MKMRIVEKMSFYSARKLGAVFIYATVLFIQNCVTVLSVTYWGTSIEMTDSRDYKYWNSYNEDRECRAPYYSIRKRFAPVVFSGTRLITNPKFCTSYCYIAPLLVLDFFPSLLLDTVILPISVPVGMYVTLLEESDNSLQQYISELKGEKK